MRDYSDFYRNRTYGLIATYLPTHFNGLTTPEKQILLIDSFL
jgi:hypothetical protein